MKNKILKLIIFLLIIGSTSCSSKNLDPLTMTLEDYKEIDFRDVVDGKAKFRKPNDITNVEIKDDREPLENEVKIPVYIYDNDRFSEAKYQYFIKGEDYRGYPYSTNYVNSQRESDGDFSGLGTQPYIIGFYEDSKFEKLIDPNKFISVDESIKEIHVRRVEERYAPYHIYAGTYKSEECDIKVDGNTYEFSYDNANYKIIIKNNYSNYEILKMYIDGTQVEDTDNYVFYVELLDNCVWQVMSLIFTTKEHEYIIPFPTPTISEIAYSAISHL